MNWPGALALGGGLGAAAGVASNLWAGTNPSLDLGPLGAYSAAIDPETGQVVTQQEAPLGMGTTVTSTPQWAGVLGGTGAGALMAAALLLEKDVEESRQRAEEELDQALAEILQRSGPSEAPPRQQQQRGQQGRQQRRLPPDRYGFWDPWAPDPAPPSPRPGPMPGAPGAMVVDVTAVPVGPSEVIVPRKAGAVVRRGRG